MAVQWDQQGELSREMVRFSRWLGRLGFTPGTSGNLSVRLDSRRLLVTPTGMSKSLLGSRDLVVIDLNGCLLEGTRNVTSEVSMHLQVYRQRPDVNSVIHAHPPIATAFACSGRALDQMLCQEAVMTLGVVPLASYATTGTAEVAASLCPFLESHDAILMANHGVISYGGTLLDAFMKMETVEHLAEVALVAHQLGTAQPLLDSQVHELKQARGRYVKNCNAEPAADKSEAAWPQIAEVLASIEQGSLDQLAPVFPEVVKRGIAR